MTMHYRVRQQGDVTILDLSGRLSLGEALAFGPGSGIVLGETIRELIKEGRKKFLLNLAEVNYVDSSGMGQLVGAFTSARKQDGDLKLLNPTRPVLDLLKLAKLDTVIDVVNDESAAIQSFSGRAAAGT
jgi:anti-sigma B factor antagonist